MAVVLKGYKLSVDLMDNNGDVTTRTYAVNGEDLDEATTNADALLADVLALTDAVQVGHEIGTVYVNDAVAFPAAGVENQNQALFDFLLANDPTKHATLSIPAPKIGIFMSTAGPGAKVIDLADAAVIAFAANFLEGGEATLSDGESIDALVAGHRRHVKSKNG